MIFQIEIQSKSPISKKKTSWFYLRPWILQNIIMSKRKPANILFIRCMNGTLVELIHFQQWYSAIMDYFKLFRDFNDDRSKIENMQGKYMMLIIDWGYIVLCIWLIGL